MTDKTKQRIEDIAGVLILAAAVAYALLSGGCAAARASTARPCLTTMPTKVKIIALAEPQHFAYIDPDGGGAKVGMRIAADADSLAGLFGYVEALEEIARKSLGCRAR